MDRVIDGEGGCSADRDSGSAIHYWAEVLNCSCRPYLASCSCSFTHSSFVHGRRRERRDDSITYIGPEIRTIRDPCLTSYDRMQAAGLMALFASSLQLAN